MYEVHNKYTQQICCSLVFLKILYGKKFELKTKLLQSIPSVLRLEISTRILGFLFLEVYTVSIVKVLNIFCLCPSNSIVEARKHINEAFIFRSKMKGQF